MTDPIGIFAACLLRAARHKKWKEARRDASNRAAKFAEFAALGKNERKTVRVAAMLMLIRGGFIIPTAKANTFALTRLGKVAATTITAGMENHLRAKQQEGRDFKDGAK